MRTTPTIVICFLLLGVAPTTAAGQQAKPTVAVLPLLHDDKTVSLDRANQVREAVRTSLESKGMSALASAEVDRLRAATDPDCTTDECMASAAGTLKVDLLVGGRLERTQGAGDWALSLWLYDARKKETSAVQAARCEGCGTVQVVGMGVQAAVDLLDKAAENKGRIRVRTRPRGALVTIDGTARGVTNGTFGVKPGKRTVVLKLEGHNTTSHTVEVKPGAEAVLDLDLPLETPVGPGDGGGGALSPRLFKWITLGAAVATIGAGIALMVMDGTETCDKVYDDELCPRRYETMTPGIALVAGGAALGSASGLLFYLDGKKKKAGGAPEQPRKTMAISPTVTRGGGGVTAVLSF